ncbi:hypothetical protein B0H14DRAFT_2641212 [Mycena olivaceomarginata]|nr:hypothetical protein B0H14DRAFT_2641212 [Mycena olivaceomarginata]
MPNTEGTGAIYRPSRGQPHDSSSLGSNVKDNIIDKCFGGVITLLRRCNVLAFSCQALGTADISKAFRVFVNQPRSKNPAHQMRHYLQGNAPMPITVLIAGTSKVTDDSELSSGGSAWFGENDPRNRSIGVPTYLHSENSGELAAILSVIQTTPVEIGLNFKLKSGHLIRKLTIDLPVHEQNGWTSDRDRMLLSSIVAGLRGRG